MRAVAVLAVMLAVAVLAMAPERARAKDWISVKGPLSDSDFYRLIACGARPGKPCRSAIVTWPEAKLRSLSVSIAGIAPRYPTAQRKAAEAALDAAIAEINAAGSALRLRRKANGRSADIRIYLLDRAAGQVVTGADARLLQGEVLGAAITKVWWNGRNRVMLAAIGVARDVNPAHLPSVMLEEVMQSLGLLNDIRDPWYETRSVFSEDSNSVTRLGHQDKIVLRRHYPPTTN